MFFPGHSPGRVAYVTSLALLAEGPQFAREPKNVAHSRPGQQNGPPDWGNKFALLVRLNMLIQQTTNWAKVAGEASQPEKP